MKQDHCVVTCNIPNMPAKHWKGPRSVAQHPTTPHPNSQIFANAHVPEVTPSSKKSGDIPSEVRRVIIRWCWGRYDTRIPSRRPTEMVRLENEGLVSNGVEQSVDGICERGDIESTILDYRRQQ